MMNTRRIVTVGIVLLAVVGAVGAAVQYQGRVGTAPTTASTETESIEKVTLRFFKDPTVVPEFTVHTIDGGTLSLADLRGKVTLINFWATWCAPCRAEIPDLIALQDKYRDQLQIIGISEDEGSPDCSVSLPLARQIADEIAAAREDRL